VKDCFDIVEDVVSLIDLPEVHSAITGKIWEHVMPGNRKVSDIIVKALFVSNDHIQHGIVNVKIHCPELFIQGSWLPDLRTFGSIADVLTPLLDNQYKHSFWTEIDRQNVSKTLEGKSMYVIRLHYYSYNQDYKNI
jgi:hypothetical protein